MAWHRKTKADILEQIKDLEQEAKLFDRRDKALTDIKKWLAARKLGYEDLKWMQREMKPKRADKPVKSKLPLQPKALKKNEKAKGDPEFRRAIFEARTEKGLSTTDVGVRLGASSGSVSNWERGRYVPTDVTRQKLLKLLGLPAHLGARAAPSDANGSAPG